MFSSKVEAKKYKSGFTFIELIVVIAIMGVLAVVLVPSYIQYFEKSREAVCRNNRAEIVRLYNTEKLTMNVDNGHELQTFTLSAFIEKNGLVCPFDGKYSVNSAQEIVCSIHGGGETLENPITPPTESARPEVVGKYYTNTNNSENYYPGDIYGQGNTFYKCISVTTESPKKNSHNWSKITTDSAYIYEKTKTYKFGDVVKNNKGKFYICITTKADIAPPMSNNGNGNSEWKKIK